MNILIVEDDELFALEIERLANKMGYNVLHSATSGEEALEFADRELPDLLLTDVKLQGVLTGIDIAKKLSDKGVSVILITAYATDEIYAAAIEQIPSAFLQKPFNIENLKAAVELAFLKIKNKASDSNRPKNIKSGTLFQNSFFIKDKSILQKVPISSIFMIEAEGNYCTVYTEKKRFVLKSSLKKMYKQLPEFSFQQVHRNYVVQLEEIEKVDTHQNTIFIREKTIPVGRKYWSELIKKLRVL